MSDLLVVDHPLVQHKLSILRDRDTPTSQFRQLLSEIALTLAYETTRDLPLENRVVQTPLCEASVPTLAGPKVALVSILRAGNGLLDGMLDLIPSARVGFVGLYRDEATLEPVEYYRKLPERLDQRLVIVVDPMLATGNSAAAAIDQVKAAGATNVRFVCLLAAQPGVERLRAAHPDVPIVTAAVDAELNEHGYIVPGLGDAGDRLYGTK